MTTTPEEISELKFSYELTVKEINIILSGLGEMKANISAPLIFKLKHLADEKVEMYCKAKNRDPDPPEEAQEE